MSTPATPAIELKLEDGTIIKAASTEEALKTAVKMYEDTKKWAKDEIGKTNHSLEEQRAELQRIAAQQAKPASNGNGFNNESYYRMLNEDPIKAQNYLDSYRFGIKDPEDVPGYFQSMDRKITAFDQQMLAAQFVQQHEEFPQTADASKALTERVKELRDGGYPVTVDTMNLAWSQLTSEGKVKPIEKRAQEQEELPPSPGGGGQIIADSEIAKAEQLPDAELEKLLRAKGILR